MQYLTRHLEAKREFAHGDRYLKAGDKFEASEVDAAYYTDRGYASEVPKPVKAAEPVKPPVRTPFKPPEKPPEKVVARAPEKTTPEKPEKAVEPTPHPTAPAGVTTFADLNPHLVPGRTL